MTACSVGVGPADSVDLFDHPIAPWLVLSRLPRFGARRWQAVVDHLACPSELLTATDSVLRELGLPASTRDMITAWQSGDIRHGGLAELGGILARCRQQRIALVAWNSDDYPEALRAIPDAPRLLYVRGDPALLRQPQVGIVGSRSATRGGLDHARRFAADLSEQGYRVTSGLALGIDGAAHQGALASGCPTLAVVGTGVDVVYPRQHRSLAESVVANGALVSELPPGTPPRAAHFPRRNRIISGLSQGILVVEASPRSGSLITARLALEQGREVFAIPGSIHNPLARGCHHLIREGAVLVESVDDILRELGEWSAPASVPRATPVPGRKPARPAPATDDPATTMTRALPDYLAAREISVIGALGYDPRSTDELCAATGLAAEELIQSLLLLEMDGLIEAAPGGFQRVS
ncbi:MAG: DNA-processing protein DprA [Marinobacter sp.]|nr:DNA-processing protein DprA [Marinobacter sp.]